MQYYYLRASLPMLFLEQPPPLAFTDYADACDTQLNPTDRRGFKALFEDPAVSSDHRFVRRWRETDTLIRDAIVRQRAQRARVDPADHVHGSDLNVGIERGVAKAFSTQNPLERERALDALRWEHLEAATMAAPFSADAVLAYGLELRLAERWAALDTERGKDTLNELLTREAGPGETST